jgi:hypothetical protein
MKFYEVYKKKTWNEGMIEIVLNASTTEIFKFLDKRSYQVPNTMI